MSAPKVTESGATVLDTRQGQPSISASPGATGSTAGHSELAQARVVPLPPAPRATDPERPDVLDPRPLEQPLQLAPCPNRPPPGCGACWYCILRNAGLGATNTVLDIALEVTPRGAKGGSGVR